MKKTILKAVFIVLATTLLLAGCGVEEPVVVDKDLYKSTYVDNKLYEKKVNNMFVILDASSSMGTAYTSDASRFIIAKIVAKGMSDTLPEGMGFGSALRTFGKESFFTLSPTKLRYLSPIHSKGKFDMGLDSITGVGGPSDLKSAILATRDDIVKLPGTTALIIISDGEYIDAAIPAIKQLKKDMGPDLCVYTMFVGEDDTDQAVMDKIAKIGLCGFSRSVDNLNVSQFIRQVFLRPAGDLDKDGVLNPSDKCPDTPRPAKVNSDGCWVIKLTLFEFDSATVRPEFYPILNEIALVMANNMELTLLLEGRADSVGPKAYNRELSKERGQAVKRYLVEAGIGAHRIVVNALGETSPLESNDTAEGRQQNRSVKSIIIKH